MTLTPTRPVPEAVSPEQQRLEVELLLQRRVFQPEDMLDCHEAVTADPNLPLERW